jgi:hypothetical protein
MLARRDILKLAGIPLVAPSLFSEPPHFWEAKQPPDWTGDEVRRMLTDSPWARAAVVRDAGVPNLYGGAHQWGSVPKKTKAWRVTVRWDSAAPIQAAIKSSSEEFEKYYVIGLVGDTRVTGQLVNDRQLFSKLQILRGSTALEPANASALQPEKVEEVSHESQRALRFYFPRRRLIMLDAQQLYFAATIGRFDVMAKFDVEYMQYRGQLAL